MYKLIEYIFQTIYIVVNIAAIFILISAFRQPRLARGLIAVIFLWGFLAILKTAIEAPRDFMELAAPAVRPYRVWMEGWFSQNIRIVAILIACLHAAIGLSLLLKGWIYHAGVIFGIVFLILISPFGTGSAFPCSLILACAMFLLLKHGNRYIWKAGIISHPIVTLKEG